MKKWWQSKTLIFNLLSILAAVLLLVQDIGFSLTADQAKLLVLGIGIVNIVLRMITSQAIAPIKE